MLLNTLPTKAVRKTDQTKTQIDAPHCFEGTDYIYWIINKPDQSRFILLQLKRGYIASVLHNFVSC